MLVMTGPTRRRSDDDGAVLVTVVVVMLVGFVIATVIAASVMFTIQSNVGNKTQTQAFIAAESGRDSAYDQLVSMASGGACSSLVSDQLTGSPAYEYEILTTTVIGQTAPAITGLSATCPTADTSWVLIRSRGLGPGDDPSDPDAGTEIESYYPWTSVLTESPGGTVAYFDGQFKATKSTYEGDLVVRRDDYECNSDSHIIGDLWVLGGADGTDGGTLTLSTGCSVTGSVYVARDIKMKGGGGQGGITIGGDMLAARDIDLDSDTITFDGDIHAGRNVDLKKSGTAANILAVGSIAQGGWTVLPDGVVDDNAAAPVFDPPLHGQGSV